LLEKPDLPDEKIIHALWTEYELKAARVAFLPLGADVNTAVYRVESEDGTLTFLKLRKGAFDELSVELTKYLSQQGIQQIIPPLAASSGLLWARLEVFTTILYPFIEGRDGYQVALSDTQWADFGAALKRIHGISLPPELASRLGRETYSPQWRAMTKNFLERVEHEVFEEPVAAKTAALMSSRSSQVLDLLDRADGCAKVLQARPLPLVLCHADLHAGNFLIEERGAFSIVDWDNPILAPKERDLMFIGGGQGFLGHTPAEEETLFYQGYGNVPVDPAALAYYRYERIVQDLAAFCEQLLSSEAGGEDREQSFQYLSSNFQPGGTIEVAYAADKARGALRTN
jgi:spectinomycin phosphotransferase